MPIRDLYPGSVETSFPEMGFSASWSSVYMLSSFSQVEPGIPVRITIDININEDTALKGSARLRFNLIEWGMVLSISQLYKMLERLKEEEIHTILKQYTEINNDIDAIKKHGFLDLRELASLIIWLTHVLQLKVTGIRLVEDPEIGKPQFVVVYIEDCGWNEWKTISRTVKRQLVSEGLDDVAGRVALVCNQAFRTRRS